MHQQTTPHLWRPEYINVRTVYDLDRAIRGALHRLPRVSLVVGVPRSGMLPATLLATYLNVRLTDIDSFINGSAFMHGRRPINDREPSDGVVLIVDDSILSGDQLRLIKSRLANSSCGAEIIYLAVFGSDKAARECDIICENVPSPRVFSWNVLNSPLVSRSCVDIDGVLCVDPSSSQNDDGNKYAQFVRDAFPLYSCKYRIGHIVTSRLEKYRSQTEDWLIRNGIQFNELHMVNLPSAQARRQQGTDFHAANKAKIFSALEDCMLFIESEDWQARLIAELARKPCFSVQMGMVHTPTTKAIRREQVRYYLSQPRAALGLCRQWLWRLER